MAGEPPRSVDVEVRDGVRELLTPAELARVVDRALDAAGAPRIASVGVTLADDAELAALNAEHLGHDGPTDVLSFPLLPVGAYPPHAGQAAGLRDPGPADGFVLPPDMPVHLGDIVVSVERAIAQASEGRGGQTGDIRWSPADELRLLVTHGALHLCGWDHAAPEEEAAMRALERALLDQIR